MLDGKYLNETARQLTKEYDELEEKNKLPLRWLTFNVHVVEFVFDAELTKAIEARPFNEDFFRMVINQLHR